MNVFVWRLRSRDGGIISSVCNLSNVATEEKLSQRHFDQSAGLARFSFKISFSCKFIAHECFANKLINS